MDINRLKEDSKRRKADWVKYFRTHKKQLEKMDLTVHALHEKYSEQIDCLTCGNCCRTLGPRITD